MSIKKSRWGHLSQGGLQQGLQGRSQCELQDG